MLRCLLKLKKWLRRKTEKFLEKKEYRTKPHTYNQMLVPCASLMPLYDCEKEVSFTTKEPFYE